MPRAPFQVLVIPFRISDTGPTYSVFKRDASTGGYWQWIAGGGEDDELPAQAAMREAQEEAGIGANAVLVPLASTTTIPVVAVRGFEWGEDVLVIPEYAFGVEVASEEFTLSHEHTECRWVSYAAAVELLCWDSNVNALWELDHRLRMRS